jgi:sugar/nucleoside kinase (ribokinase family)
MATIKKQTLICIGDVVMDAFIILEKASVHEHPDREHLEICMPFADKIPYRSLTVMPAVGNASNVAVGARRLGIDTSIITAVGNDYYGKEILNWYRREKVGTKFVKINNGKPTNYHFVLNYGPERTILIKHEDYEYADPARMGAPDWIYFSSIGEHTLGFHEKVAKYLAAHPNVKMAFNPGTFQLKFGPKKLKKIYERSYTLFVNREEAELILGAKRDNIKELLSGLRKLGPKVVVITDGPLGAYASDDDSCYFMPPYPDPKAPVSRTGAGDAFSSGFLSGLIYGLSVPEALKWAPIESMHVVQYFGAQTGLLTKPELLKLLKKAPKGYQSKFI